MYDEQNLTYYTKNKKIELTLLEHKAFMILLKNKNQITTYKQLCQELYGTELYQMWGLLHPRHQAEESEYPSRQVGTDV